MYQFVFIPREDDSLIVLVPKVYSVRLLKDTAGSAQAQLTI